jgi:hypothetical protein
LVVVSGDGSSELNDKDQKLEEVDMHILRVLWVEGETCTQVNVIIDTCPEMQIWAKRPPTEFTCVSRGEKRMIPSNEICYGNFPGVSGNGEIIQNLLKTETNV